MIEWIPKSDESLVELARDYEDVKAFMFDVLATRGYVIDLANRTGWMPFTREEAEAVRELVLSSYEQAHNIELDARYRRSLIAAR